MTGGINDRVVPLVCEELLGGAGDGHTTLTLLLLPVHVEGKGEGLLAQGSSLLLELLKLTLRDTTQLEQQTSSGGGLAGVNMPCRADRWKSLHS